jgi:Transposase
MKRSRFNEEQIKEVLREHEDGAKTEEVCRRHGDLKRDTLPVEIEVRGP